MCVSFGKLFNFCLFVFRLFFSLQSARIKKKRETYVHDHPNTEVTRTHLES